MTLNYEITLQELNNLKQARNTVQKYLIETNEDELDVINSQIKRIFNNIRNDNDLVARAMNGEPAFEEEAKIIEQKYSSPRSKIFRKTEDPSFDSRTKNLIDLLNDIGIGTTELEETNYTIKGTNKTKRTYALTGQTIGLPFSLMSSTVPKIPETLPEIIYTGAKVAAIQTLSLLASINIFSGHIKSDLKQLRETATETDKYLRDTYLNCTKD